MTTSHHLDGRTPVRVEPISRVLATAAVAALRAPSIWNTQPWHWRIDHDVAQLRADRRRQLRSIDPEGRLLTVSCGVALHHARVALAAVGTEAVVDRLPDTDDPDLLATLRYAGTADWSPDAQRLRRAIAARRSDRRPFADRTVPQDVVDRLCDAARRAGADLDIVRPQDLTTLTVAAGHAASAQQADPAYRAELATWTGAGRQAGEGVPPDTVAAVGARPVPLRDFTGADPGPSIYSGIDVADRNARYGVIVTDVDQPAAWLVAGEALSAVLLTATAERLATSAMSDLVEDPTSRAMLRRMLGNVGHPAIGVRIGVPGSGAAPPQAPRRAAADAVEVVADPGGPHPADG
ncbi:nitroreductase [Dactylosporangium sp. NBC_01737]|uniref:Acg family FMN-binding oxidoreductase n=1 Tax=Dactylosporangium sp. NBC_01737 TaxID=2975959 RepID=UPI002E154729|nr:nitroreductase [Dactylosporangium sp. NBC_01737]